METDILVRTTTTDGSDLRYMTTGRVTDATAAERTEMADSGSENPFQDPPVNDRSAGIGFLCCITYFWIVFRADQSYCLVWSMRKEKF